MQVTCVNCSHSGTINDSKIYSQAIIIKCQNCGANIKVHQETYKQFQLAVTFYRHKLYDKAKIELINLACGDKADFITAKAIYLLGEISYAMKQYDIAIEEWKKLIQYYPKMDESMAVKERIALLQEVTTKVDDLSIASPLAQSYLKNGDYWSESTMTYMIDPAFLDTLQMAIEWYDLTIKECNGTAAAELAYARKLFALLGWEKESHLAGSPATEGIGLKKDCKRYPEEYAECFTQFLDTFSLFEKDFPESPYLQGFRLQIAQQYWKGKDWDNTRKWLEKMVAAGNDVATFYTHVAKKRLEKALEYA